MKRRAVAASGRSDDDRIPANGGISNGALNRHLHQDKTGRSRPNHKSRQNQNAELGKSEARKDRYLRHDRETIFFRVLSVTGAAFVAMGCFTFSIFCEEGNGSVASSSWGVDRFSFLSDKFNVYSERKGHEIPHPTANTFVSPQNEFKDIMPTYFGEIIEGMHPNRPKTDNAIIQEAESCDFGGLRLNHNMGTTRRIKQDPFQMLSDFRDYRSAVKDDDVDYYYADDDYERNPFVELYEEEYFCRRTSEMLLHFPNCNSFHETPFLESEATNIGAGEYRQTMRIRNSFAQTKETIVIKDIHLSNNLMYDAYEFSRMDAIVAERLTASPRIYNIYGHCGIGIMAEYLANGHIEKIAIPSWDVPEEYLEEEGPLISYNNLSGLVKLKISLQMAEALADLHGYPGGVIVHQDVKLDQFFFNADKSEVILNDFNRAEFMLWDYRNEEYCGYKEGFGAGNWRSPEEYHDEFLNEKVDVFSLGNNMYGLLTGLGVFHEINTYDEVQYMVGAGVKAWMDQRYKERSLAEAKLAEIIEKCHEYYEEDRPSIFEVVDFLQRAVEEVHEKMNKKS